MSAPQLRTDFFVIPIISIGITFSFVIASVFRVAISLRLFLLSSFSRFIANRLRNDKR